MPGERVGIGRTAEVFAWSDGRVVKVLRPGFPARLADEEARVSTLIDAVVGDEAPRFFGHVTVQGRPGLVYERLHGSTMLDAVTRRPWFVRRYANDLAALHARMHDAPGAGLPTLKEGWGFAIERSSNILGADRAAAVLERLAALPDGDRICHGDMHPGNVLMSAAGPKVIDWMSAKAGPPEADVARTLFLLTGSDVPKSYPRVQRVLIAGVRQLFARAYLNAYRRLRALDGEMLRAWRLPVFAARLSEDIDEERAALLRKIDADLATER